VAVSSLWRLTRANPQSLGNAYMHQFIRTSPHPLPPPHHHVADVSAHTHPPPSVFHAQERQRLEATISSQLQLLDRRASEQREAITQQCTEYTAQTARDTQEAMSTWANDVSCLSYLCRILAAPPICTYLANTQFTPHTPVNLVAVCTALTPVAL